MMMMMIMMMMMSPPNKCKNKNKQFLFTRVTVQIFCLPKKLQMLVWLWSQLHVVRLWRCMGTVSVRCSSWCHEWINLYHGWLTVIVELSYITFNTSCCFMEYGQQMCRVLYPYCTRLCLCVLALLESLEGNRVPPMKQIESARSSRRPRLTLEESWTSLSVFNQTQKGRISLDIQG